jgi:hypothetical protein
VSNEDITPTCTAIDGPCLRVSLIEHAMRLVGDDVLVWPLRTASPGTPELLACVGRILAAAPGLLPAGTPLRVWAAPGAARPLRSDWRELCRNRQSTLWVELETLRALYGSTAATDDPLAELTALRLLS